MKMTRNIFLVYFIVYIMFKHIFKKIILPSKFTFLFLENNILVCGKQVYICYINIVTPVVPLFCN